MLSIRESFDLSEAQMKWSKWNLHPHRIYVAYTFCANQSNILQQDIHIKNYKFWLQ